MGEQQSLFAEPTCPHHGPENVCDRCPERYDTGGDGFVHKSLLKGRAALRECRICKRMTTRAAWNAKSWTCCLECAPET
jgi:hypothetical protein